MLLRRDFRMHRILAVTVLAAGLGGCAMQMPSFSGAFEDDGAKPPPPPVRTASAAQTAKPKETGEKQSSITGSLAGFWDSVSSPFSSAEKSEGGPSATMVPAGRPDIMAAKFNPAEAQSLINAYRAKFNLPPLRIHPKLAQAAKVQAEDLAKHDRISHFGSDGSDIEERARRSGYVFHLIAENIGTGQNSTAEIIQGWQKSPSHNENLLLPDAEHMGIALVYNPRSEFKTFWALVVGKGA